jgi:hypothetical protein
MSFFLEIRHNLIFNDAVRLPRKLGWVIDWISLLLGYGVATLAQNKIFPAKQKLLLWEITGLPLDAQMQRNRLDVDERVEGSRQCSCLRPSWLACAARPIKCSRCSTSKVSTRTEEEATHTGLLGPRVRRGESVGGAAATWKVVPFQEGCGPYLLGGKSPTPSSISNTGLIDGVALPTLMGFTTFVTH